MAGLTTCFLGLVLPTWEETAPRAHLCPACRGPQGDGRGPTGLEPPVLPALSLLAKWVVGTVRCVHSPSPRRS